MAKRKRNQQATPANNQNAAATPSKKPKIVNETSRNAGPKDKPASGKPTVASPDAKRQPTSTTSKPEITEAAGAPDPAQSSSSLKRERKRKRLRELKKNALSSGEAEGQKPSELPEQKSIPQELPVAPVKEVPQPTTVLPEKKSAKSKASQGQKQISVDSSGKPTGMGKGQSSDVAPGSKKKHDSKKKTINGPPDAPVTGKSESEHGQVGDKPSKKKLRRQSAFRAKQAAASMDGQQQAIPTPKSNIESPNQAKSRSSIPSVPKPEATTSDTALLQQTTKTHLLPRPIKQWVEQDDVEQDDSTTANDASTNHQAGNSIVDPLEDALRSSPARSSPDHKKSTPSSKKTHAGSVNELPGFLATVGVPSTNETPSTVSTPLARPGINTIASFSLSSRRHPASILAKQRPISGLSGIKMDTGMIGSSPKPVSANKANSVPSYAGRGDVKAAFDRFNKFAHGGNSSESDDDDSDESDEDSNEPATIQPSQREAAKASATPSKSTSEPKVSVSVLNDQENKNERTGGDTHDKSTKSEVTSSGLTGVNNTVRTNDPTENSASDSAESSESDDEAGEDASMEEVQPVETTGIPSTSDYIEAPNSQQDMLAQPLNNAPRMLGEKDLPLFSDFNAKHNITPADTAIERSANFLERELGGAPSGFGQTDDAEIPIIDYVASQDADDLYRSIEDISREVFGSIRELPDCKPLSNTLDVSTEPLVTDEISNHGLGRKSAESQTPLDKTTILSNVVRGPSPVVYITNEMDIDTRIILKDDDEDDEGDEEQDQVNGEEHNADDEPLDATQNAELERQSSTPSSLSTLTPSPTPSETERQNTTADTKNRETDVDDEHDVHSANSNDPLPAKEAKKRKLTGITSKHFSPRKALPRAASTRVESASVYAEEVAVHDTDDEIEQPASSDDHSEEPQPLKPKKKKGTGKTSTYFTPTSSPSKPTDTKKTTPLPKTPRPPAGTSTCLVPSTNSTYFGLIQEKLWKEPFWLIIAVTFLNKTAGRAAAPIFWNLKELYPTPEALSQAKEKDLVEMIETLGLQNQRAKRLILIAKTWLANPPAKSQRYRTFNYPVKGDGKDIKKDQVVEEDADDCEGALEIGHIPGCGPYAWDSWRIFCRDVQRGLAHHFNDRRKGFEPEWQRVVPLDKELRACLRWMWLREGYVWDHETGKRRDATLQEMDAGLKGEMVIDDEQERKFAREAAGVGVDGNENAGAVVKDESGDEKKESVDKVAPSKKAAKARSRKMSIARRELDIESGEEAVVSTVRRSRRNKAG
jgi:hypothetical protein